MKFTIKSPRNLFLLDGLGAILSSVFLGLVLTRWEYIFGIPHSMLYFLTIQPVFFALYDLYCFIKIPKRIGLYLILIAVMNISYCCVSIGFSIYHSKVLTLMGWIYIAVEITIILLLAYLEYNIGKKLLVIKS